jgi:uroporphyrinogen-III decarboxylase
MNGREKIEAAFTQEGTPEIGAVLCYEGIYIRDHWSKLTRLPWWYDRSPDLEHALAWRREVIPGIGQDWMFLPTCNRYDYRQTHTIETRGEDVLLIDRATGRFQKLEPPIVGGWDSFGRGYSGHVPHLAQTIQELDDLIPAPDPVNASEFLASGQADLARRLLHEFPDLYPLGSVSSPLWSCYYLWGFEGMMETIVQRPDLVHAACQRFLQQEISSLHYSAAMGVRGIWIEECLTDTIHPRDFKNLNSPYVRALVEEIHALGMHSIYYYCGDPARKIDLILDSGTDALALEEGKKGFSIDMSQMAETVNGRCVLLGNLDAIHLLPNASEDELRSEIIRQVQAGRRNRSRFVMSIGSPVTPETTPAQVRLYCDLVHEIGS